MLGGLQRPAAFFGVISKRVKKNVQEKNCLAAPFFAARILNRIKEKGKKGLGKTGVTVVLLV